MKEQLHSTFYMIPNMITGKVSLDRIDDFLKNVSLLFRIMFTPMTTFIRVNYLTSLDLRTTISRKTLSGLVVEARTIALASRLLLSLGMMRNSLDSLLLHVGVSDYGLKEICTS